MSSRPVGRIAVGVIRNGKGFPTATQATPAHTYMNSPVFVADELKWAGFDMVNHANNHAMDYSFEGLHESVEKRTPEGRWGVPRDLAGVAAFLSSEASNFVTGAAIPVDGGFSIGM